jgi:hypothetical protein
MRHMVNGRIVEVFAEADGSVPSAAVRQAANIPQDRPLILQLPDGSNKIINPGENVPLTSDQFFIDAPAHKRGWRDDARLKEDLDCLSAFFSTWVEEASRFVIVRNVRLPPAYNYVETDIWLDIPADYPYSPPGIGDSRVYISPDLRFYGRVLADLHPTTIPRYWVPGFGPWAWFCYQVVLWNCFTDDLVKFVEMVRADLTSATTR